MEFLSLFVLSDIVDAVTTLILQAVEYIADLLLAGQTGKVVYILAAVSVAVTGVHYAIASRTSSEKMLKYKVLLIPTGLAMAVTATVLLVTLTSGGSGTDTFTYTSLSGDTLAIPYYNVAERADEIRGTMSTSIRAGVWAFLIGLPLAGVAYFLVSRVSKQSKTVQTG